MLLQFQRTPSSDELFPTNPLYISVEQGDLERLIILLEQQPLQEKLEQSAGLLLKLARDKGHEDIHNYLIERPEVNAALKLQAVQQAKLNKILKNKTAL